ncbi:hypothetical protein BIW11_04634 [Tropilaelaps mercedesae]|uniref:Uncharacterized protein n=1 Tax=Tropilaelaps mercedesae TaxID=418985 RepID=A0A1V9X3V0_9ACAR|nr:hypothetical protein BIW11_04634 [Tropilaelaps mercedesae]
MSGDYTGVSWDLSNEGEDRELGRELQKRLTFDETDHDAVDKPRGRTENVTGSSGRNSRRWTSRKTSVLSETSGTQSSSVGRTRKSKSPSGTGSYHHFRSGQQQPLRVAPHDPSLSLSDPGNLHPKRHLTSRENGKNKHRSRTHREFGGHPDSVNSSHSSSQHRHHNTHHSVTTVVRRKSDSSATNNSNCGRGIMSLSSASSGSCSVGNNSIWGPALPPSLRNQHLAHKCSWADGASVSAGSSSRSSSDLLASPGPARVAGHSHGQVYSYSVPSTPSARTRRHGIASSGSPLCAFEAFLPLCEIQAGLKKGEFFEDAGSKWHIESGG